MLVRALLRLTVMPSQYSQVRYSRGVGLRQGVSVYSLDPPHSLPPCPDDSLGRGYAVQASRIVQGAHQDGMSIRTTVELHVSNSSRRLQVLALYLRPTGHHPS